MNSDYEMAGPAKKLEASKDRISQLLDEILVYILSMLTMKEAGRTSLLSKRWRHVWAYIPVLNFDAPKTLFQLMSNYEKIEVEKARYISWVDLVVSSYKRQTIDEFTVRFDIDESNRYNIDKWVKFAMDKKVRRLRLDFLDYFLEGQERCYNFSCLSFCKSLTSLQLCSVSVTGDVLENILNNCPQIESVKVHWCDSLVNLNVPRASVHLKYLEITWCFEVEEIEINAPNLISFKYFGPKVSVPFKNTYKLVELLIGGDYAEHLLNNFSELSSYLSQLQVFILDIDTRRPFNMKHIKGFPLCTMLKQLEVNGRPGEDGNLFGWGSMINACPFLYKFILKLNWWKPLLERELSRKEACPHYHLKIVEIGGFYGHAIDKEFIMYLMESCVALEKIVIDPRRPSDIGTPQEFVNTEKKQAAREEAEKLRARLKPTVDLIII